ncbi:MAG TPA: chromate efflux transporter [Ignavibacteria bacterium]|nr:chromate efflux transporter [Ignavibacteria bacterium]
MNEPSTNKTTLSEIARLFLKLGITGFGGPAAHISMMRHEVVLKKKWMTEEHFLDLVGATNLIPGPNSTEMAIHIGREKGGWKGLLIAGACFIIPAVVITAVIAWFYRLYGALPEVQSFIFGIKPAIIAIIIVNIYPLAVKAGRSAVLVILGVIAAVLSLLGYNEILIVFGAGLISWMIYLFTSGIKGSRFNSIAPVFAANFLLQSAPGNLSLFLTFLKVGSILYGSGYVLFAFLESEFVATGILTQQQLVDAIAVGQFTPGPVFSAVTFIGWQINGIEGALVSTLGIFMPSFLFVAFLNPLVKKMRTSKAFAAILDGVNVASIALIVSVCIMFGRESFVDWRAILIAAVCLAVCFRFKKLNTAWIVLGGSLAGYLLLLL